MTRVFRFEVLASEGNARHGRIDTAHGSVRTPAFMPVGSAGSVKALYPDQVRACGTDIILGNTYHLMLRPGAERVAALGGLHGLIGWDGPILTDSGGFQVMSLAKLRKVGRNGVTFQSHLDGARHELTPERAMEIQGLLGSDVHMQLDECLEYPHPKKEALRAMRLSLEWAARSRAAFANGQGRGCFGIVQGGVEEDLRRESAAGLRSIDFDGYAIGGLAVGEGQSLMLRTIEATVPELPSDKPRYLMGVGTPEDILEFNGTRHRHAGLRHAHPRRPARPGVHQPGTPQPEERQICRRSPTARRDEFVPRIHPLLARLSSSSREVG